MYEVLYICITIIVLASLSCFTYYMTQIGRERVRQAGYSKRSSIRGLTPGPRQEGILGLLQDFAPLLQEPAVRDMILNHLSSQKSPPQETPPVSDGIVWADGRKYPK